MFGCVPRRITPTLMVGGRAKDDAGGLVAAVRRFQQLDYADHGVNRIAPQFRP